MGFMNFLAAARVMASNFVICAAVERAILRASPSAASCATSPTACARVAFTLRPVRSRSRTKALPRSRLRRGMPPKPGMRPRRSSGKAKRAILSATMMSQASANAAFFRRSASRRLSIVHGVDFGGEARVDGIAAELAVDGEQAVIGCEGIVDDRKITDLAIVRKAGIDGVEGGLHGLRLDGADDKRAKIAAAIPNDNHVLRSG